MDLDGLEQRAIHGLRASFPARLHLNLQHSLRESRVSTKELKIGSQRLWLGTSRAGGG